MIFCLPGVMMELTQVLPLALKYGNNSHFNLVFTPTFNILTETHAALLPEF